MKVKLSTDDSESIGLTIYRACAYLENVFANDLLQAFYEHKADLIKLKVSTAFPEVFVELNKARIPFEIQNIVERGSVQIPVEIITPKLTGITVELANCSKRPEIERLLEQILNTPTAIKYHSIFRIYTKAQYAEATKNFLLRLLEEKDSAIWIVRDDDIPVAYFSGRFSDDSFEGMLYGVHPNHRKRGISHFIYQTVLSICFERGIRYFTTDIETQNTGSIRGARGVGMSTKSYYHINCFAFLGPSVSLLPMVWEQETSNHQWTHAFRNLPNDLKHIPMCIDYWKKTLADERTIYGKCYYHGNRVVGHELFLSVESNS